MRDLRRVVPGFALDSGCSRPRDDAGGRRRRGLAAKAQRADNGPVARGVLLHEVREKAPALAHELEEAAARMVVLGEASEVLRQIPDPLRQERDLDLGRSRVAVLDGVLRDDLLLLLPRERHSILRHERWRDCISLFFDRRRITSGLDSGKQRTTLTRRRRAWRTLAAREPTRRAS